MNSIAILPRTMMNVLQNLNIKRDTLEKRAHIPDQFKPKSTSTSTVSPATNNTAPPSAVTAVSPATGADQALLPPINPQQYDNQYWPSSLRNHQNPFSIPAVANMPEADKQVISSVLGAPLAESASAGTTDAASGVASIDSSELLQQSTVL